MLPPTKVLSLPAGRSYNLTKEFFIYACPASYDYESTTLITFRAALPDAAMEKVFTIQRVEVFDPVDLRAVRGLPEAVQMRIAGYLGPASHVGVLDRPGRYRFYILDPNAVTVLPHAPKTAQPQGGAIYFTLAELQAGTQIVTPLH